MNKWILTILISLLVPLLACGAVYVESQYNTAEGYIVVPASEDPSYDPASYKGADSTLTFWDLPLKLKMIHIFNIFLVTIGLAKLSPLILSKFSLIFANKNRNNVFEYIVSNPGCSVADISHGLELNRGTAKYHLKKLHNEHKITVYDHGSSPRFFQNNSVCSEQAQILAPFLQDANQKQILLMIRDKPGMTNNEISQTLCITNSTVSYHLKKMTTNELLQAEKDGRFKRYSLNPRMESELDKIMHADI
ncbi:winged helix-turn-helix transcriptional regulator [Methanococcoides burtonii]|uniref:Transcriptional regulator, ArsR family protein n=1 Tax=Methanococcoides burtonii (strain DSM 6242 / NBRC 107633 / OCM 468 / ACE-M) TaxID=259564 RepID=Q12Z82_METBU|nr:winged helix-turn-helix transcriptional regulator [Methanococcoides burtonii]ABE51244.1 Transcriptional regulator, ArsR family protein [Methanococcoides burtonii DSM 6242]